MKLREELDKWVTGLGLEDEPTIADIDDLESTIIQVFRSAHPVRWINPKPSDVDKCIGFNAAIDILEENESKLLEEFE